MLTLASLPLAEALPAKPGLLESLGYQLNGIIVVFLALASIWLLLEIIGRVFKLVNAKSAASGPRTAPAVATPAPATPAPSPTPAAATPVAPGLAPDLVAAIVAAVHVAVGQHARVAQIVPIMTNTWARDGRRQIFSSHQPR